jgi:catechol 2,3-dioxygenase-like lactoylglutathione lyase family enzyme
MAKALVTKDSIDLGIVVCDANASLAFYRDLLGFEFQGEMPMPGGGTMYRLLCGTTVLKLVKADSELSKPAAGGITGACGYRYFTISVSNLEEITSAVGAAGYTVTVSPREIRAGISISIVQDPDGNLVEFLQVS